MDSRYALDRGNAKILGVCAGLARSIDYDPLVIRMLALLALVLLGPVTIAAYLLTGWLAD
jgi:phage shock protein C